MLSDWSLLTEELQLALSQEAMRQASAVIAEQAEILADELECGRLADDGGPNALRLLATIIRLNGGQPLVPVGHA
ncbi:MAG: hypothetical protein M3Y41_04505 [Pseudomonadota bacterium]|nr:hypothetical protein [Pseudomonadota bacterium]